MKVRILALLVLLPLTVLPVCGVDLSFSQAPRIMACPRTGDWAKGYRICWKRPWISWVDCCATVWALH